MITGSPLNVALQGQPFVYQGEQINHAISCAANAIANLSRLLSAANSIAGVGPVALERSSRDSPLSNANPPPDARTYTRSPSLPGSAQADWRTAACDGRAWNTSSTSFAWAKDMGKTARGQRCSRHDAAECMEPSSSFTGEHPEALDAAGVRVNRVRWAAVLVSGALAGMGGASLSVFLASSFSRNMTAGRGFMALAALIFGKWKPVPTAIACLLFGFAEAVQIRLQGVSLWGGKPIPVQFIQILPYLVTILVLAGFVGRSRAPKALGTVFRRA